MISVTVTGDKIAIRAPFALKDLCKSLPGARWSPAEKVWTYPATPMTALEIATGLNGHNYGSDDAFVRLAGKARDAFKAAPHKKAADADLPPYKTRTVPWTHQKQAFWFCRDLPAAMLAMEMGTGKSKVVVDLCVNRGFRRILITCPLSVVDVWPREFATHADGFEVLALSKGSVADRMQEAFDRMRFCAAKGRPFVCVINHEGVWREPFGTWACKRADFDCLVVDESHRSKQHNGQLSTYLAALAKTVPVRLALTGTPMPHSPLDIFAQYRFLDPGVYGSSWFRFKNRYAVMGGFQNKQIIRYDNLDELNERMYRLAFRVTKDEALDLPEQLHEARYCDLEPKTRKIYDDIDKALYAKVDKGEITASNALVELLRLQQVTGGSINTDDGLVQRMCEEKSKVFSDLIGDIGNEPIVVFAQFHEDLNQIAEATIAAGRRYGEVSGRIKNLKEGRYPDDVDVLGCQIHAGGVGIDLTRARFGVYWSTGFNLGDYEQSLSRLHRPGQHHKVTFIHLLARNTIDEKVYGALKARRSLIEECLKR